MYDTCHMVGGINICAAAKGNSRPSLLPTFTADPHLHAHPIMWKSSKRPFKSSTDVAVVEERKSTLENFVQAKIDGIHITFRMHGRACALAVLCVAPNAPFPSRIKLSAGCDAQSSDQRRNARILET